MTCAPSAPVGKGLHADVGGDRRLAVAGRERRYGIGMAQARGQMVEAMWVPLQLLGGHLQHHGVEGQTHPRHGDAVLVAEIGGRGCWD